MPDQELAPCRERQDRLLLNDALSICARLYNAAEIKQFWV